jgi:hypothetical protein
VLNNQPQGGFVTRQPSVDVPVASGEFWGEGNPGFGFFFQRNFSPQPVYPLRRGGQYYRPAQPGLW